MATTTTPVLVGAVILIGLRHVPHFAVVRGGGGGGLPVGMDICRLTEQRRLLAKVRPSTTPSWAAYAMGLLHGLAGSGALVLLVMSEIRSPWLSVLYFAVFGVGAILDMFVVAGLCSVPFTKRMRISRPLKTVAITLSSLVCILCGGWMIYGKVQC